MATAQGIVRFHQQERTLTFRVEGRATMNQSTPMRRCAERAIDAGATRICVDLRNCSYMDSTFLGTLLTLRKLIDNRCHGEMILITPSEACCRILHQMGLLDVLTMQSVEMDPSAVWSELPAETPDAGTFKRTIAQAHQELANLPGPAGEQFKAVARCMAQAEPPQPAPPPASPPKE
jgi:anti-sigma B factor antagonist